MSGPMIALGAAALLCLLLTLAALPLMRAACRQRVPRCHLPQPPHTRRGPAGGPHAGRRLSDRSRVYRVRG